MTVLHDELRMWADESAGAARVLGGMAEAVDSGVHGWSSRVDAWTGSAAVAFEVLEDRLVRDVTAIGEAFRTAATAHHVLSVALREAVETALRSAVIDRGADDLTRSWHRRRAAWEDTDLEGAVDPPPTTDPGDLERRRARQLAAEARRTAAEAAAAFAAHLDTATAALPVDERRSITELASEFGSGVVDSVRDALGAVWELSSIRMVLDADGWRRDATKTAEGMAEAIRHPGEAFRQMLDVDTWRDNPARAVGRLAPDLVVGALTGGAGAGAARARTGLRGARRVAGELVDSAGSPRRDFVPPRPDDPASPVINLTAVGDRMGNNASRITPIEGHTDVAIHGSPTAFGTTPDGPSLPPSTVADMIAANPKFEGGPIRLISCRSGASSCGAADTLAGELGVDVLAPNTTVWVYPDGRLLVGEGRFSGRGLEITEPGEWIRFTPGER